jgi:nucleoside phosphorylase
VLFFWGGWGKIAAAGSTQYVIDRWRPQLLVNLGTCGGFDGAIERDMVVLAIKTVVYDIVEQMGHHEDANVIVFNARGQSHGREADVECRGSMAGIISPIRSRKPGAH